jgi:hypothetical protein
MRKAAEPRNICRFFRLRGFLRCSAPQYSASALNITVRCTFWMICYAVSTNIIGALHLTASLKQINDISRTRQF